MPKCSKNEWDDNVGRAEWLQFLSRCRCKISRINDSGSRAVKALTEKATTNSCSFPVLCATLHACERATRTSVIFLICSLFICTTITHSFACELWCMNHSRLKMQCYIMHFGIDVEYTTTAGLELIYSNLMNSRCVHATAYLYTYNEKFSTNGILRFCFFHFSFRNNNSHTHKFVEDISVINTGSEDSWEINMAYPYTGFQMLTLVESLFFVVVVVLNFKCFIWKLQAAWKYAFFFTLLFEWTTTKAMKKTTEQNDT